MAFKANWGLLKGGISLELPEKFHKKLLKSTSISNFLDAYEVVILKGTQSEVKEIDMNDPDINKMVTILNY